MKKITLLFCILFLSVNVCFASIPKIPKQEKVSYCLEIQQFIDASENIEKEKADKIFKEAQELYGTFLQDKNRMKYNKNILDKFDNYIMNLENQEFTLLTQYIDIIKKYVNIDFYIPATDSTATLFNFIYDNYAKKYNITNFNDFIITTSYISNKQNQITYFYNQINEYSIEYETKKEQNFYKKYVVPKQSKDLDDLILWNDYSVLKANQIYLTRVNVLQIHPNGFLGLTSAGEGKTIFIKTNLAHILRYNDLFLPCLPVKFTGHYQSYTNLMGEIKTVPIFDEVTPTEYKKVMTIPKIGEEFYFIEKPVWKTTLEYVSLYNPNVPSYGPSRIFRKGY